MLRFESHRDAVMFTAVMWAAAVTLSLIFTHVTFTLSKPTTHWDYMFNSFAIASLLSLTVCYLIGRKLVQLSHLQKDVARQARLDPLTNLLNRRAMTEIIEREHKRQKRLGSQAVLILVDIDHFKSVNDTLGHSAGDEVLCRAAGLIGEETRPGTDHLCRWGGEEFLILATDTTAEGARQLCERLRERFVMTKFDAGSEEVNITISLGAAPLGWFRTLAETLDAADKCLYEAKNTGRNRTVILSERPLPRIVPSVDDLLVSKIA